MKGYIIVDGDKITQALPFYERFPIKDESYMLVDVPDDFFSGNLLEYSFKDGSVVMDKIKVDYETNLAVLAEELESIKQWFTDTDYIPNKIVVGEWTTSDPRWVQYLADRATKRARQDTITTIMRGDL